MKSHSDVMMLVFWLVTMIISSVYSSKEAVMLEISSLLRSNSRSHFASDRMFFDAHDALFSKIISNTNSTAQHPFVISLYLDCSKCHDSLIHAGNFSERYRVISAMKAIFYGKVNEIEELKLRYPHSIKYYVPLLPSAKIDIALRTMTSIPSSEGGCSDITTTTNVNISNKESILKSSIKLTVVVAPLSVLDLEMFVQDLKSMQTNTNIIFTFDTSELQHDKERSSYFTVNNCQNVLNLVLLLSEKREILWIERSHDIRINNKWAKGICQSGVYSDTPAYASNLTG